MSQPDFNRLRETLVRGGIAPKRVRRYIAELNDHADDLIADGILPEAAWAQLGSEETLAAKMLEREELKTLGARYPRAFFGAGPAAVLLLSYIAATLVLMGTVIAATSIFGGQDQDFILAYRPLVDGYCAIVKYALPVVVGIGFAFFVARGRVTFPWLFAGLAFIAFCGASADLSVAWPEIAGVKKELNFGFGFGWADPPFLSMTDTLTRSFINFAMMSPTLAWIWWQSRSMAPR